MTTRVQWSDLTLFGPLGQGQAGQVYLATLNRSAGSLAAGERVAVKRYKRWVLEQSGQYERIVRELAASAKVRHQNVVENISLVTDTDTSLPALVMKYYEGATMESLLDASRANGTGLPLEDAFRLIGETIEGVAALHGAGIYHRDVKPANIMIDNKSGSAVVMDLGVVSDFLLAEQTQTIDFLGTIRYADPNYLGGGAFTAASDWYSVGLIGYELFFGVRFLGSEEHWAKIVFEKLRHTLPTLEDLAQRCERFAGQLGQNAAEAVFHTLQTLLFKSQKLQGLRSGISKRFWTGPFYEQGDAEIVLGEPSEIIDLPRSKCDNEEPSEFAAFVRDRYWGWRTEGSVLSRDPERPYDKFPEYVRGSGDDVEYNWIQIDARDLALHRYGRL